MVARATSRSAAKDENGRVHTVDPRAQVLPPRLRVHQQRALAAVAKTAAAGCPRAWVVLPPGAGKTLVGLEVARRRGWTAVFFGPNTAVQRQWCDGWDAYGTVPAGASRDLGSPFTALTYQALATFADADDVDADDGQHGSLVEALHPNGRALVRRLREIGDVTVVLDECHHRLQVWGRLLRDVLAELPDAFVLGLAARRRP